MSSQQSLRFVDDRDGSRSAILLARGREARRDRELALVVARDGSTRRRCVMCPKRIPKGARRDARTCSQRCRQARYRARRQAARLLASHRGFEPRRLLTKAARSRASSWEVLID